MWIKQIINKIMSVIKLCCDNLRHCLSLSRFILLSLRTFPSPLLSGALWMISEMLRQLIFFPSQHRACVIKPCAAKTVYIRFQANDKLHKMPLKCVTYLVVDAQLSNM